MVENEAGTVRRVCWQELLPWLIIFRCFGIARRVRMLLLAAAGIVLTAGGWAALGVVLPGAAEGLPTPASEQQQAAPLVPLDALVPDSPQLIATWPRARVAVPPQIAAESPALTLQHSGEPVLGSLEQLSRPFRRMFAGDITIGRFFVLLVAALWALAVWGFLGGAITRVAAVSLAGDEHLPWSEMMAHVRSKWLAYFGGPLIPLVPVGFVAAGLALMGMLLWTNIGVLLAALIWPLLLLGGLGITVLLLGLVFGWPLMWATVSTEGTDGFDAVSRTYSYVFQRPLHYLFYLLVAAAFGALCWILVANFAAAVIALTDWSVEWSANGTRWAAAGSDARSIGVLLREGGDMGLFAALGSQLIYFWRSCVKLLAVSFLYSYFWTATTAVYLLLRRDVDATELDEVFLEREQESPEQQPEQPAGAAADAQPAPADQTITQAEATLAERPGNPETPTDSATPASGAESPEEE